MEIIHVSNPKNRFLKPKKPLQINNSEVNAAKKCLFGAPDAQDVEDLLQEQIREDWERIKDRFGIDMEDIENMESARREAYTPRKRKLETSRRNARRRRLFQPYPNDKKITGAFPLPGYLKPLKTCEVGKKCYLIGISVVTVWCSSCDLGLKIFRF
ncbi:hypothetical protein TcasGA2_TC008048 [Tribolium castaneum]|uniref:Uncharacterized protein n=1 Tax=Tribolium castaneum TaxID=7070 RepID=A0A139WJ67_TRICA|nr:hypothetical protein TcasGA2_TC008048 [Tribolium castaneum]